SGDHRDLLSFPTRRSSDLSHFHGEGTEGRGHRRECQSWIRGSTWTSPSTLGANLDDLVPKESARKARQAWRPSTGRSLVGCVCRSEEHTSELQSRFDLVCR